MIRAIISMFANKELARLHAEADRRLNNAAAARAQVIEYCNKYAAN